MTSYRKVKTFSTFFGQTAQLTRNSPSARQVLRRWRSCLPGPSRPRLPRRLGQSPVGQTVLKAGPHILNLVHTNSAPFSSYKKKISSSYGSVEGVGVVIREVRGHPQGCDGRRMSWILLTDPVWQSNDCVYWALQGTVTCVTFGNQMTVVTAGIHCYLGSHLAFKWPWFGSTDCSWNLPVINEHMPLFVLKILFGIHQYFTLIEALCISRPVAFPFKVKVASRYEALCMTRPRHYITFK